jgi:class 3 adenylate cyclase
MRCSTCSHENPDTNKFCAECGTELVAVCSSCGTTNPPSSKFCGECGVDLRGSTPAPVAPGKAERRLVSVLFADLVGFTPFSESRDPEEVRSLLTTYFDRSREIVERFGGEVDKFIGDAVMAVWGAVEAREDDAERSVRAALDLVDMVTGLGEEIGVPGLALRAGVMSGETSVGPGGNEKGLVVGDLVNTASRLQSIAEPGTVLVGEPTRVLTSVSIAFEELGPQTVKGKETPVPAFRALRILSERGGARRVEGLEPPFTGRDVELRMLKDQFHATGRDHGARLVSVVGEAGIGKTRLSWELEKYMDGLAESVYWHRGRSPSYGEGLTMWALGEMVRSRAGIADTDDAAKSRLKLRTAVAEYVTSDEDRRWLEPRLAALLGLETAPAGDRDELFAAFRAFFHHISALGTTVLVFEDMHWADPGLLDFITELVERSPRNPIFVVALSRPEVLETRPGFGSGHRNSVSLHLAPLSDASMTELITAMVPGISTDAAASLVERAGGIPMYAVEFVRMLLAGGELADEGGELRVTGSLDDLALPESLQAVVGARLDRLAPVYRELVQDAAVLGQSFTADGLAIVRGSDADTVGGELMPLVRQQLFEIEDDPRSPERGQYRFVQSVIREVAYGRLSKDDRYAKHLTVAQYFEGLEGTELVGAVASHYIAAHDAAPRGEGEDLIERGRTALREAAGRAIDLGSYEAALSLLGQALELADDPTERAHLLERGADAATWASLVERSVEMAAEAAALYEEIGDHAGRLRALTQQAFTMSSNFRADESIALLVPVYEAMAEPTTEEEVALALETARAYMLGQQHDPAIEIGDRVLAQAEAMLPPAAVIDGIITRATALARTRTMEALALLTGVAPGVSVLPHGSTGACRTPRWPTSATATSPRRNGSSTSWSPTTSTNRNSNRRDPFGRRSLPLARGHPSSLQNCGKRRRYGMTPPTSRCRR